MNRFISLVFYFKEMLVEYLNKYKEFSQMNSYTKGVRFTWQPNYARTWCEIIG